MSGSAPDTTAGARGRGDLTDKKKMTDAATERRGKPSAPRGLRLLLDRHGNEAVAFGVLRSLTLIGGLSALSIVPLRPEHRIHLAPLLAGVVAYKAALFAVLARWAERARAIFLATLSVDLGFIFVLVWFAGGSASPFYLLFYLLVALNAYYFGPGIGVAAAAASSLLLAVANWLAPPSAAWADIWARGLVLCLLALGLGYVADRERAARARAERLHREATTAIARLARAERLAAVGRLSAKMAHEVRNPLGAMNLNLDMLGEIVGDCQGTSRLEGLELVTAIREEVRALAALTDEYLVAARLPSPAFELDSLNDLLTELVAFLRPLADRQQSALVLDLDPELPPLPVDRTMLKQAVINLIKNGLEAVERGGRITVRTRRDEKAVAVTVADTGPGIAPEAVERLYEPFFSTKPRGTGLGLSIAQQIAREHGGELTVSSPVGHGAEFRLRLPVAGGAECSVR